MTETKTGAALALVTEQSAPLTVSGSVRLNGLGEVFSLADRLAKAKGFVPRAFLGDAGAIAAAVITGIELGIGPMESLRSFHVIEGRVTMTADFMLARAIRAGIVVTWLEASANRARIKLQRTGFPAYEQTWSMDDAKAAGLAGKDNWKKYPAAMLRARAVSAALRAYCPDVLGSGIYTAEEVTSGNLPDVPIDAEIVDPATGEVHPSPPPAQLAQCKTLDAVLEWCRARTADGKQTDRARVDKHLARLVGDAPESERAEVRKLVDAALGVQPEREPGDDTPAFDEDDDGLQSALDRDVGDR